MSNPTFFKYGWILISKIIPSIFLIIYLCPSCKENKYTASHKAVSDVVMHEVLSDDNLSELYQNYATDPMTQAEIDQNLIIDYAVENNLNVKFTSSGLYFQIFKDGVGEHLKLGEDVKVLYKGYFLSGSIFESNLEKKEALDVNIGKMIEGWNEALQLMKKGSKALIIVPSHLAYGSIGVPGKVEPNSVLIFELEVML